MDKILNFQHNSVMIGHYYHVDVSRALLTSLGIMEFILLLAFLAGLFKTLTYGVVLIAHSVTTIASFSRLLPPYEIHQLLYFGSLPMLAACFTLFLLRDQDTMMNFSKSKETHMS
ncbi:hypothetical protein Q6D67_19805 [Haliea sp. E1-2-M8]|uniref:hypothetical protein n=1 Tax=Haliea sp. E1-2-M8 TaxID=3064706 RepID=UPI00272622AA|nr:hypothetical protein [Haliea sp. E1-2-M8]MDO8863938.1 hypothetical protein [Haliea sp. E1-2-M8]